VAVTRPRTAGSADTGLIAVDRQAPDIVATTLDGTAFRLSELRGRPVVINFWGPSCVPCRTEFPLLARELARHAGQGLAVVGVLTDDPPDLAATFIAKYGATWPTVTDPNKQIKAAYRVVARPQSYFMDRAGILRSIQIGEMFDADFERQFTAIAG
jgi:cytochrome c biogenesis protein CcmG/thiol:disulfide interchange protein DsbE